MSVLDSIVQIHRNLDWNSLVLFYSVIAAVVSFVAVQMLRARNRLNERMAELEARFRQRLDERTAGVPESILSIEARTLELRQEAESFGQRVDQVENSIPNLHEQLEEFRTTLSTIFQNELSAVLGSFDNSVAAVLDQMKADLHTGITRIESIENMVRSRRKAGRALLELPGTPELAEAPESEEEAAEEETSEVQVVALGEAEQAGEPVEALFGAEAALEEQAAVLEADEPADALLETEVAPEEEAKETGRIFVSAEGAVEQVEQATAESEEPDEKAEAA